VYVKENLVKRFINKKHPLFILCLAGLIIMDVPVFAQKQTKPVSPLVVVNGTITYNPDSLGNRIPDFSYAGYMAGEKPIPNVSIKVVVPVTNGDATLRIQSAIDYVASLPLDQNGFRGTVLLQKGTYKIEGQLKINAAGIVLRGSGLNSTILLGEGNARETLIRIAGVNNRVLSKEVNITDNFVPVNADKISVQSPVIFKMGDRVIIHRPCTKKWIEDLGTEHFGGGITALGWKPGERDIYFDRKIVSVNGNAIILDAPLTTALDTTYGLSTISSYTWPGRIQNVGVENLSCQSVYDINNPKDEAHRWMAITMDNVEDGWVRQISFKNFAGSVVNVLETSKRITIEDCKSLHPVSEIGGQRRYSFFATGQQILFQRCHAENGYHDFAVGFCTPGPNAFVQCEAVQPYNFSGAVDSWASGVLFDIVNVDGNALRFGNRGQDGQGAGWSAANSVFWQCSAARIDCYKPPTANNWAFGSWAQFSGDGYWESSNEQIKPRSLYYSQLSDRIGDSVLRRSFLLPVETEASSSPPVSVAMELTGRSKKPALLLTDWIDAASTRQPIPVNTNGIKTIDQIGIKKGTPIKMAPPMQIKNGWLVRGDEVITGKRIEVQWWSGSILPNDLPQMKPHITRFVPGRTGFGLTDDLEEATAAMKLNNVVAIEHNYGLWYDRRRDDHERIRRMDGEVWPPFYELPFARSGKELAWDGLSKYDLTKYNPWYWGRLKNFADLADQKSLVLIHQNYFQHNVIEAGAHYADFPWRTANNINNTGFPEPVAYAGDKRLFMAEQFYDIINSTRRKIHTAYIRKCLDNFKNNTGVIQFIGAEYTGPLDFVQFWLDVIKQWEKETNRKEIIGLSTTKDVQDAILSDKNRASVVDLIDIRYWHYQEDGTTYEPKGGQNLAPRQHARLLKPKRTSFEQIYRAVSEYKNKFPGKVVMYSGDSYDQFGWAVLMAGGSMAVLPPLPEQFLADASSMKPLVATAKKRWVLTNGKGYIIYSETSGSISLNLLSGAYTQNQIDPKTGKLLSPGEEIQGGKVHEFSISQMPVVLWVRPK
jgi:ribosomal protein L28